MMPGVRGHALALTRPIALTSAVGGVRGRLRRAAASAAEMPPGVETMPAPASGAAAGADATSADDTVLVRGALAGRREDFDRLVERHQRALYAFVYRLVRNRDQTADIMQVSFLQAYTHLAQFEGRASFKTWLHQIALNQCRGAFRGAAAESGVALDEVAENAVAAPDNTAEAGWRPALERSIQRLPLRQRTVLILRIFSDLAFKDIARIEGISENAAKVNYHHAIVRLRSWLRRDAR